MISALWPLRWLEARKKVLRDPLCLKENAQKAELPFVPCQRKNQHAAGHAEALGITLLDSNQQSMHGSGTKNLCHLLTWETDAKKLIGWEESCGSEGNPCGERGVTGHTGESRANH